MLMKTTENVLSATDWKQWNDCLVVFVSDSTDKNIIWDNQF